MMFKANTFLLAALCTLMLVTSAAAKKKTDQQASTADSQAVEDSKQAVTKRRSRLPRYFGKLGLDQKQREDIYAIQADYQQQLAELQAAIAKLKKSRDQDVRKVLSTKQKQMLSEISKPKTKPVSTKRRSKSRSRKK